MDKEDRIAMWIELGIIWIAFIVFTLLEMKKGSL